MKSEDSRKVEEGFRRLFEYAPTPYHTLSADGKITNVNRQWCRVMGFKREEVIGRSIFDFIVEKEQADARRSFESRKKKPDMFAEGRERHFETRAGAIKTFRINEFVSTNTNGEIVAIHSTMEDITKEEKNEQQLRKANVLLSKALTELRRTQKQVVIHERLSALGQMASGMAHDFNNALMPIVGFSDYLLTTPDALEDREEAVNILKDIRAAAEDAKEAVQRLRSFYRPADEGKQVPLNVNDIIKTCIELTQPRWQEEMGARGATIEISTDLRKLPLVKGNEARLREAMTNLLMNSFDAMPEGGTVIVTTSVEEGTVVVRVSDTGRGMDEDTRQKCFEPFFTTKGRSATGMGLAVVFGTIRGHKGSIEVSSKVGEGSTFTVHLPVHTESDDAADSEDSVIPQLNILLIDDEARTREAVDKFLQRDHHTVVISESGTDGLKQYHAGNFDLVITDRAMPDMSGDKVALSVMAAGRHTPVIMLTGFGEVMKDSDEQPPGVTVILSKPVTKAELRHAIARALKSKPASSSKC